MNDRDKKISASEEATNDRKYHKQHVRVGQKKLCVIKAYENTKDQLEYKFNENKVYVNQY